MAARRHSNPDRWGRLVRLVQALACVLIVTSAGGVNAQAQEARGADAIVIGEPGPLDDVINLPVRRVEVVQTGSRWTSPAAVRSVKPGEPMTAAVARRAARELLDTGGFARLEVRAYREGDGAVLRLECVPRRLVTARRVSGSPIDEGDLWREAGVSSEEELTEERLTELGRVLREALRARGFWSAAVQVETRPTDDPMRVVLSVEVNAGSPRRIADRVMVLPSVRAEALNDVVKGYGVDAGDRADEVALRAADLALTEQLQSRGYASASVAHRLLTTAGWTYLYVYVTPGPRTLLRFEGNETFDADRLAAVVDFDHETDRSPTHIAEKLRKFYQRAGFLDVAIEVERRGSATDPEQELVFKVREGEVVRVVSRVYPCLRGGPRSASEVTAEIDSFLEEELPGGDLIGPVDPGVVDDTMGPTAGRGARPAPFVAEPTQTYVPDVYERAVKHVQDLYRSEGYLSATVGPVQIIRRACSTQSPPGRCIALPLAATPANACVFDTRNIPREEPEADPRLQCRPDPARGVTCEPRLWLRIPVKLGPAATLYDVAFEGNRAMTEAQLLEEAELKLGAPASNLELEQARRRVLAAYHELGFAYAEVRADLDLSSDRTRARAHFTVNESQQVFVERIVVTGATRTSHSLILGRVALRVGQPYRQSDIRKTEERIATLGTFSSVSVSLQDPYVPAKRKVVIIHVQERVPQYLDIRPGFSTGEGFRVQTEYGHINIAGEAIQLTLRLRLSYLPDLFIQDPAVRTNLGTLPLSQRLERHNTVSVLFPEVGLGPLISLGVDGADVRSNARDFGLTKNAVSTALTYRPVRTFTTSLGGSLERNDVAIFGGESVDQYLQRPGVTSDLRRLLLAPDGLTYAVAERWTAMWDRRDNPLGATRGTVLGGTVEHVRAFPAEDNPNTITSDFIRVSAVISGYVRLSKRGLSLAASLRTGRAFQLMADSKTYPDRLFFLGGVDSLRGFLPDSVVPQDVAEKILQDQALPRTDPAKLTVDKVAIRGGDVFVNPRAELRIPLSGIVQTTLFMDAGNLWVDPRSIEPWKLRYAAGSGLRVGTPIGPLAFDYGVNLDRRPWEDFGAFHFSIGLF
jgi:outer membrane protein insertion porin family